MITFSPEVRELALKASFGYCQVDGCTKMAVEMHHKLSNTKVNQRLYPLFLQSIFNCCPICRQCHQDKKPKVSQQWASVYEEYLRGISGQTA